MGEVTSTYYLTVTDKYGEIDSDSATVAVYPAPLVDLGNDTVIMSTDTIILNAGTGFSEYAWQDGSTSLQFPVFGPQLGVGEYTFYVSVIDGNGCHGSDTIAVTIKDNASVSSQKEPGFTCFPNPVNSLLHVSAKGNFHSSIRIKIFDLQSHLIVEYQLSDIGRDESMLNLSGLESGIYFLHITYGKELVVAKLVKL